jgi:hypothetical protein
MGLGRLGLLAGGGGRFVLNFEGGSLPPGVTFTRASDGSYFNSSGILTTAVSDAPRFEYNPATLGFRGLLYEPQRENKLQRNREFNDAYWTKSQTAVSANATEGPDGNATADKITELAASSAHSVTRASGLTISAGAAHALGVVVEASERTAVVIGAFNDSFGNGFFSSFNLATGAVHASGASGSGTSNGGAILALPDNKFLLETRGIVGGSATSAGVILASQNPVGTDSYLGVVNSGLFMSWAQLEEGAALSSLIATAGSAVVRAADSLQFNIPARVASLIYTFDDDSEQTVAITPGDFVSSPYTVPTNLNRRWIKKIREG